MCIVHTREPVCEAERVRAEGSGRMLSTRSGARPHLRPIPGCLVGSPCSHRLLAPLGGHRTHLCPGPLAVLL